MSTQTPRPVSILIAALGGEGGGVLADWVTAAIQAAGFPVQGTSIPGVAQRTGATTYYIEFYPVPFAELGGRRPVFGLVPVPGRVDIMLASELIEAARAAQNGFVSPQRTTLIGSTHRVYATAEKIHMGDGRFDEARALKAAHEMAQRAILFDMQAASEQAGTVINSVLLGALAGSGALPIAAHYFENVMKASGRALAANERGYQLGFKAAAEGLLPAVAEDKPAPAKCEHAVALDEFPIETRFMIGSGYDRCLDFLDHAYAQDYLARVHEIAALDRKLGGAAHGWRLTLETARYLALRMTFEDIMRVADLKTRASRFAGIRAEARAQAHEPVHVTEFLKPGPEEFCALLPRRLGDRLLDYLRRSGREDRLNIGIHLKSHTVTGFLLLRLLARLRFLRRGSWRFAQEAALNERWVAAVRDAAALDYGFGVEVALCADLVKGYGSTYRRGVRNFDLVMRELVEPAIAQRRSSASEVAEARKAALADPEGDALDRTLARVADKSARVIAA
jgi:indolepyruvate ferredoxin oxidoreductase beta subunit